MPGDALTGLFDASDIDPARVLELRAMHGLDLPWYQQYFRWISGIVQGDWGTSMINHRPVLSLLGERITNTLRLAVFTLVLTYLIAIPLGLAAAKNKGKIIDKAIIVFTFFILAMPTVIFALINIFVFGFRMGLFPVRGSVSVLAEAGTWYYFISRIQHLILPGITGAILNIVFIVNIFRSEIIDVENSDFVTTARAKGVPRKTVFTKHIMRNASVPLAAGVGSAIATLVTGSVFIEQIFSFPGMGHLFFQSMVGRDFSVVNSIVLLSSFFIAMGTLSGDIILTIIDPRIRIK